MKRIVIMGATSGIGLETAKRCIAAGWRVGAAGRRSEELERLRGLAPQQVETEAIDVTDDAAPAALERLIERLGGMDVYLHVAGVGSQNPQLDPTVELHTVRTNVEGFTRMTTAAYGYFAAHGGGRIAVVSSIAGTRGLGVAAAYSASKRFQNTYIDSLAQLARMQGSKIRFTDIRPGFVATKMAKGDKKFLHEVELFSDLAKHLDAGKSARTFEVSSDDAELIATADLLSLKPIIYAANMDEDGFANQDGNQYLQQVKELAEKEGAQVLPICAKLEQDIAELDGDDRAMFLEELGIQESGLDRLIKCSYALLGLISFLTYGEDECRAWTIKNGTKAPQAAGKIHSDIERGFIRAETINFDDMIRCGSVAAAKEKGLLRSEGKEYVVKDGDMIYFRFNV